MKINHTNRAHTLRAAAFLTSQCAPEHLPRENPGRRFDLGARYFRVGYTVCQK